ncbi:MAG TPA: DUF2470 domain-containing protein [Solirubrobacteraceae bacterium]|nr:DUF2470 domain-containing protein [Solirubrobacteraceae bacterium]
MNVLRDHGDVGDAPSVPPPLAETDPVPRLSAAEAARTLLAGTNLAALATLDGSGAPWSSLVTFGALEDGSPVLCLSRLAEHGRNAAGDPRASLMITESALPADPLAAGRVTLAGTLWRPAGGSAELAAARAVHLAAVPSARIYVDFSDFAVWVLAVERVRWVGGYGRMDWAPAEGYGAAAPDPVAPRAAGAVTHLNADHRDALLSIARALGGYPDAASASASGVDRYGIDLIVETPRGRAPARVAWSSPLTDAAELRAASVALTHRARAALEQS